MNRTTGIIAIFAVFALVKFVEEYFWAIALILLIGVVVYFYPKYAHTELQKKSMETDIKAKENDMMLKQMEMKIKLLELEAKNNKRNAKTEQIDLSNEILKQKLNQNQRGRLSGYDDQINRFNS